MEALKEANPKIAIEQFENGKAVIDRLTDGNLLALPDLIILDYNMPLVTGLDVLVHLSADGDLSLIPKFVWSTSHSETTVEQCLAHGALDYFKKPKDLTGYGTLAEAMLKRIDRFS